MKTGTSTAPDTWVRGEAIVEVYERYRHLDRVLSDARGRTELTSEDDTHTRDFRSVILRDLWLAIVAAMETSKPADSELRTQHGETQCD